MYRFKPFNFQSLIDLLLPTSCIWCGKIGKDQLCCNCVTKIPHKPLSKQLNSIDKLYSFTPYEAIVKKALWEIKFNGIQSLCLALSQWLNSISPSLKFNNECIFIPVPLHKSRLRKRGFNQVTDIWKDCLGKNKQTLIPLFMRSKATQELFSFEKEKRELILDNAFQLSNSKLCPTVSIKNKIVILVDDIVTTGSTLSKLGDLAKKHGASTVIALTLCYAPTFMDNKKSENTKLNSSKKR